MKDRLEQLAEGVRGIHVITHISDFDGMASAAALVRYLHVPLPNVSFGGPALADIRPPLRNLLSKGVRGSLIVLTDLALDSAALGFVPGAIEALRRRGNRIAWIDHHPWSGSAVSRIEKECDLFVAGKEIRQCATELVLEALRAFDGYARRARRLSHIVDFNLPLPRNDRNTILTMVRAITYSLYKDDKDARLRRIVRALSRGEFGDAFIRDCSGAYLRESAKSIAELKRNATRFDVNGYSIGIGHSRMIQSTQACAIVHDKLHTDIDVFINLTHGKVNIRSQPGVDCSVLAEALGGGGHPQASAASLKRAPKGERGIDACTRRILRAASSSLAGKRHK